MGTLALAPSAASQIPLLALGISYWVMQPLGDGHMGVGVELPWQCQLVVKLIWLFTAQPSTVNS